ncbi:hypothetical protein [Kineosporia sp. A_224]|uniref:hypothetical protein n=1 Tax=Kineosporia sp. A_224 TaxID=1962180 RepID=UPI0018E9DB45|nr:hypothetical protein [Kineosporia sp. A_224]
MHRHAAPSRPADGSRRTLALATAAAALLVAFVVAPGPLAARGSGRTFAGQDGLVEAVRVAFVEFWGSGARAFPPALAGVVDYWFRYHVAKAVIAAVATVVLLALGARLWTAFRSADRLGAGRGAALVGAGGLVAALVVASVAVVMANVQGALAPFASALSLLPVGETDGALAGALGQARQQLTGYPAGGRTPGLDLMVDDFARYHLVLAVTGAVVAAAFAGAGVLMWRRAARTGPGERRAGRALRAGAVGSAALSVVVLVVVAANVTTAADPAPALLAFFAGGL